MRNKFFSFFMLALIMMPALALALPVNAQTSLDKDALFQGNADLGGAAGINQNLGGLSEQDPRIIVARVINVILGFLGIVAVIIIMFGGFKWMTSGGSEDKIGEAKKMMIAGVVGLIIVLASFGLAQFAIDAIFSALR